MFRNLTKNQKLKLIGSFTSTAIIGIVVVIALVLFLNPSLAWFSYNKQVSGTGMGVRVGYDDFHVSATCYQYDPKKSKVKTFSDLSEIDFNPYDLVFSARNRYTPVVVALKITGASLPSKGTVNVRITRDLSADPEGFSTDQGGHKHLIEVFSSVMRVTAYVGKSYYSDSAEMLYSQVDSSAHYDYVRSQTGNVNEYASNAQPQSVVFTAVEMIQDSNLISSVTKAGYVDISVRYNNEDVFVTEDGVSTLIVYLYVTYDEGYTVQTQQGATVTSNKGLLGIYQKTTETGSIAAGGDITGQSIQFENDLTQIRVTRE